jgi:hypothetical protein
LVRAARLVPGFALAAVLSFPALASAEPNAAKWHERYERAKDTLAQGRAADASKEFESLAADAPTPEDERLARELLDVARETARRYQSYLAPHVRSSDELTVLYASAFVYGLGTSSWVVLLTKPESLAGAVLPFAGLTTSAVAGVAVADGYRPFRRGVPHSIAAGLFLGFGEGAWLIGYQRAGAARRDDGSGWQSEEVAGALWAGATLGGITGGVIGALREPTPGRVSFTTSAGVWGGLIGGFGAAALESRDERRGETAFAAGGLTYNLGILGGIVFAPLVAPSVARVRFADLGAIGGGLLVSGGYAILAESSATARGGLGFAALGAAAGLGVTWWLTEGMPSDPPSKPATASVRPLALPTEGGLILGLHGAL